MKLYWKTGKNLTDFPTDFKAGEKENQRKCRPKDHGYEEVYAYFMH